jgi:hypothetical protein
MRFAQCALLLLLVLSFVGSSPASADERGRLVVRITGTFSGVIPSNLNITGPQTSESTMLGAVAISRGEIHFDGLIPGIYHVSMSGVAAETDVSRLDFGIHPGRTTVVALDLGTWTFRLERDRPDPFGVDDDWSPLSLGSLSGSGEEGALDAETSPLASRGACIDGSDITDRAFRRESTVRGRGIASALSIPIGAVSASEESGARSILSDSQERFIDVEGASGSQGGGSGEATGSYSLGELPWKPRFFASARALRHSDEAPSVFGGAKLPHNDLDALDLLTRLDLEPGPSTRLGLFLYGTGSTRNYFLEAFRKDASHSPREDRAAFNGGGRVEHRFGSRTLVLAEGDWMRTYAATGDGKFFDTLARYGQPTGEWIKTDPLGLYWADGHVYNYFRKLVQVDLTGRLEAWRDAGSPRAMGLGVLYRRGTFRSYENMNPIGVFLGEGGLTEVNSIGYQMTGQFHDDAAGHEPGKPVSYGAFVTARRPVAGGDVEIGARLTGYKTAQRPLADFTRPVETTGTGETLVTSAEVSRSNVDPRVAFSHPIGGRARLWVIGGITTRIPPSEALYYSADFVKHANNPLAPPESTVIGNPALKPERDFTVVAAAGVRASDSVWLRAGVAGTRTQDAITPRAFPTETGSTIFAYVNDDKREVADLFARIQIAASGAVSILGSYDLSKARTETIEPLLLDSDWNDSSLPIRNVGVHEGLPPILPAFDDGTDRGFFASSSDRRHRLSGILIVHPSTGNAEDQSLFQSTEFTFAVHAASGAPFTPVAPYEAGSLPERRIVVGNVINSERGPWTGQLDVRAARDFPMHHGAVQFWIEALNVTNAHNVAHIYQATGLDNSDASDRMSELEYRTRLKDPIRFGDARTFRVGLRLIAHRGEEM